MTRSSERSALRLGILGRALGPGRASGTIRREAVGLGRVRLISASSVSRRTPVRSATLET